MNFYPHHIGDYRSATVHLSNEEDLAYRRLLEMYYDTEQPIPLDTQWVSRRLRIGTECIVSVLDDFFEQTETGYVHQRCEREIVAYNKKADAARKNGKKGGRRKAAQTGYLNPVGSDPVSGSNRDAPEALSNQEPGTKNQEPGTPEREAKSPPTTDVVAPPAEQTKPATEKNGKRLTIKVLPDEWAHFCLQERPDLQPLTVWKAFSDYWSDLPGARGRKLDWAGTWRNWVRNEKAPKHGVKTREQHADAWGGGIDAMEAMTIDGEVREVAHG